VRIIALRTLKEFYSDPRYRDSELPIEAWYYEARQAQWRTSADVKAQYRQASFVGNNRVVFNIGGNKYRLVVEFHYASGIGFIRFIGTHAEYDKIDVEKI